MNKVLNSVRSSRTGNRQPHNGYNSAYYNYQNSNRKQNNDESEKKSSEVSNNRKTEQSSQSNEKTIVLVADGSGNTKESATKNALRSAIEQAFGTFVSANTKVLDDELIKDEIVTVSTGNIKTYKELSSIKTDSGYEVSVQATVRE